MKVEIKGGFIIKTTDISHIADQNYLEDAIVCAKKFNLQPRRAILAILGWFVSI